MSSFPGISAAWVASRFPELVGLAPLGAGGQKLVFSATHPTDGDVVLKLIRPPVDVEGFAREILAVTNVASPRVPKIISQGVIPSPLGDCFWLREERVAGDTVRSELAAGPFTTDRFLRLGSDMLEALVAAEAASIVHRDVKPENIVASPNGEFSLLDFGIARHLQLTSQTPTAALFGKCTPGYAPPEQFRNVKTDIDARSDLFALGVTLYECATGANPFIIGAGTPLQMLQRVQTIPLPRLRLSFPGSSDFADLVASMTQKRRDHRPSTAKEALDWMRDVCDKQGK